MPRRGTCPRVTERTAVARVHTPTGSASDLNSNKEAKGGVASWMVSALTLAGQLGAEWTPHLVPGMFSQSGIAITERSSVLIDWNEVIYPLVT